MTTIIKNWGPAILAAILGLALAFGVIGPLVTAHAAPRHFEIPHNNHVTTQTGDVTLAMDGNFAVMWHGKEWFNPKTNSTGWDACGNATPPRYMNFGLMVRPDMVVTDTATGETYRIHGAFKYTGNQLGVGGSEHCGDIWNRTWLDRIEIVAPDRTYRVEGRFFMEVNIATGELLALEIDGLWLF